MSGASIASGNRATRRRFGIGLRQLGLYRPRTSPRNGPRHPLAMPTKGGTR